MRGMSFGQGNADKVVVLAGNYAATLPTQQPDNVILDRIEIVAASTGKRGIEAHTRNFTLSESRVVGFLYAGSDSQAFVSYNGPGPYNLLSSELEASGENILFGGGTTTTFDMIPSNVKIFDNLIRKPLAWKSSLGTVKNSIEFKCVKGASVNGNTIDGCWKDQQAGHMIVLTPRNQYGLSPFTTVEDVVIQNNRTVNHLNGYAVSILLTDEFIHPHIRKELLSKVNLFQDSPKGIIIQGGLLDYLRVK